MRKYRLALKEPSSGWHPSFTPPKQVPAAVAADLALPAGPQPPQRRAAPRAGVMAYFPTWKGGRRMERLRHYFHEDMAVLLEADPDVLRWTADAEAVEAEHDDGAVRAFVPSMRAETRRGVRLIKLRDDCRRDGTRRGEGPVRPSPLALPAATFERLTRSELASHPRLAASAEILFHRPRDLAPALPLRVASMAALEPFPDLGAVLHRLEGRAAWEDVLALVARGHVEVDMSFPLGPDMPVVCCKPGGHLG